MFKLFTDKSIAKIADRQAKEKKRGRKLGGRKPIVPDPKPCEKDQINLTDEESRIMPVSGGGFEQTYNAQVSVDMESLLIVGNHMSQNTNDKQEVEPALQELKKLPKELEKVENAALDSGYFSEDNVNKLEKEGINPYIASGRQSHYPPLEERLKEVAAFETPKNHEVDEGQENINNQEILDDFQKEIFVSNESKSNKKTDETLQKKESVIAMQTRMKSPEGREFYAKRKSTVEPVFGIIKNVMGFRHFLLRGLEAVSGEWNLVCIAFNLKRIHALTL